MNPAEENKTGLNCYNCNELVNLSHRYCPSCGQSNHPTKLTVGILIKDFVDNFFNLDSRFFKTLFHIYSPTYLTREYVAGRRIKYANPIRLFVISIVILFGLLTVHLDDAIRVNRFGNMTDRMTRDTTRAALLEKFDAYSDSIEMNSSQIEIKDSLRTHLFKNTNYLDSTYLDFSNFISFDKEVNYKFLVTDVLNMDPDSILVKYEITEFKEKVFVKQVLKIYVNGRETIKYLIGNSLWIIVLTVIISAMMLKLLYIRHKIYYIEHIILLCNIHSFVFLLIIIPLTLAFWYPIGSQIATTILSIYLLYVLIVFKRYYQQGFIKTLIKYIIYVFTYNFVLVICTIFVLLVSFLLF